MESALNPGEPATGTAPAAGSVPPEGGARRSSWYGPFISPRHWQFWVWVLLLVYTLGGFFLAPWLIKRNAEQAVADLGRTLSIGQVKVNPYVLSVQLLDTKLHDTDGTLLLSFDEFFVNLQLSSLFRWAWTFSEIRLVKPFVLYERFGLGDDRILRFLGSLPKPEEPPEPDAGLGRIIIQQFHTIDGRFGMVDHLEEGVYSVEFGPITSNVLEVSTIPDQTGKQSVTVAFPGGGSIEWSGSLQLNPLMSKGRLALVARQLEEVNNYMNLVAPFEFAGNTAQISANYELAQTGQDTISASVANLKLDVTGITLGLPATEGSEAATVLSIPSLRVEGESARWPEQTVTLNAIKVESPELNVVRYTDLTLNLQKLAGTRPGGSTTTVAAAVEPETSGAEEPETEGIEPAAGEPQPAATDMAESETTEPATVTETPEEAAPPEQVVEATEPAEDSAAAAATPTAAAQEWQIELKEFAITDGTVNFTDESFEPPGAIALRSLALELRDINNQEGTAIPAALGFSPAGEGNVRFDGTLVLMPALVADGALKVTSMGLSALQPWVAQLANVQVDAGAVSLDGNVHHDAQELASYKGSLDIAGFVLMDTRREEQLAGWDMLDINRVELSLGNRTVGTSEISLAKPFGRLAIAPDKATNLNGLFKEAKTPAAAEGDAAEPERPMAITIDGFKIQDMALEFSDLSLPLPFRATIRNMDGTISTLATGSNEPARVSLEGQVNEYGQARIEGSLNAWSPVDFTDIQMIFRNLEMERITPYTVAFAGWEIDAGRLNLDLDYNVKSGKLDGNNDIVIHDLVLGDKVENPDGTSLPLRLAVALLTDSEGVIDLGLPVSGDLNDPKFRLGGVIVKAILNLIAKAVTAPFRLLGSLVGVDSEDFGTLGFAPGSSEVSPPDREKLAKLVEAMQKRPELALEVDGVYVAELDRPALQTKRVDAQLDAAITAGERESDELSSAIRRKALEAMFQQAFPEVTLESVQEDYKIPDPDEERDGDKEPKLVLDETAYMEGLRRRLIQHESVTDMDLVQLADARATAVLALLQPADGSHAFTVARGTAGEGKANASGEVALDLKVTVEEKSSTPESSAE